MPGYRAYVIGSDSHVQQRVDLFCEDDDEAKQRAKSLVNGHDIELWQGERLVEKLKHRHGADSRTG